MFRADAGIVQSGGDGVHRRDLSVLILAEVGFHTMENAQPPGVDGGCRLEGVDTSPGRLAADEPHVFILNKKGKTSDGVGSAAHAGQHRVGEASLLRKNLFFDFLRNNRLKIPDDGGERMGTHHRAQTVMGVLNPVGPLPHGLGDRVLQCGGFRVLTGTTSAPRRRIR